MSKQFFLFIGLFSGAMIHTQADAMLLVDGRYVRNIFDRGDFREPDYSGRPPHQYWDTTVFPATVFSIWAGSARAPDGASIGGTQDSSVNESYFEATVHVGAHDQGSGREGVGHPIWTREQSFSEYSIRFALDSAHSFSTEFTPTWGMTEGSEVEIYGPRIGYGLTGALGDVFSFGRDDSVTLTGTLPAGEYVLSAWAAVGRSGPLGDQWADFRMSFTLEQVTVPEAGSSALLLTLGLAGLWRVKQYFLKDAPGKCLNHCGQANKTKESLRRSPG